jgi:dihydrofolate reductase
MKTILIFVTSLDGKVTKWGDPNVKAWSSHQDQDYYTKVWSDSKLIVMGSNTFNAEPKTPSSSHLLVIMTKHPETYKNLESPGQIEFTNETPGALSERFKLQGWGQMLVVGGPHIATSFLKEQLVDELWLTLEPRIFGTGGNFATSEQLDIALRLIDSWKVNEHGTLISRYAVIKG